MKHIFCWIIICLYCIPIPLLQAAEHVNIFAGMPFDGYTTTAPAAYNNSASSVIAAQGGYAIDMSFANMNNQTAYSMSLDNHLKRINTFFQGRIDNGYYRDMEEWRKKEKTRLKAMGAYDGDAIRRIYGK
jgi:hypothetical protein